MSSRAKYPSLKGRTVVVTGGGTGIGAEIVKAFCATGSKVAFFDINEQASTVLVDEIAQEVGERPLFVHVDLTDIEALRRAVDEVSTALGPINVLVNNAANDTRHTIESVDVEFWQKCVATNLDHYFFACQAVVGQMEQLGGGSIINMSSISWVSGMKNLSAYVTANAGIMGMTRSMARELGERNIRVNSVIPGWIMTQRQLDNWVTEENEKAWLERQCLKKLLVPEDVSPLILFLAADDSRMITSQHYAVDGGYI